jgi:hypothetical protein
MRANGFGEEGCGGSLVPLCREEKVNGLAMFVYSALDERREVAGQR